MFSFNEIDLLPALTGFGVRIQKRGRDYRDTKKGLWNGTHTNPKEMDAIRTCEKDGWRRIACSIDLPELRGERRERDDGKQTHDAVILHCQSYEIKQLN